MGERGFDTHRRGSAFSLRICTSGPTTLIAKITKPAVGNNFVSDFTQFLLILPCKRGVSPRAQALQTWCFALRPSLANVVFPTIF